MKYTYQDDDMSSLRRTFEDMIDEISTLRGQLSEGDDTIMELYNEANDLEDQLFRLREHHSQSMFDAEEDYLELERDYNELAEQFTSLFDEVHPIPDFDDDDQFDIFEVTSISFD